MAQEVADFIQELKDLDYIGAKKLISQMEERRRNTQLSTFWSFCSHVLWNADDGQDEQTILTNWLVKITRRMVPSDCDSLIRALLTCDKEGLNHYSQEMSRYLPVICAAPVSESTPDKEAPEFLKGKWFKVGSKIVQGEAVWKVLLGDVSEMVSADLNWLVLFALHFWYRADETDMRSSFYSFAKSYIWQLAEYDPTFCLMSCYSDGRKSIEHVINALPAVDGYIFLHIAKQLDGAKTSSVKESLHTMICVQGLINEGLWPLGVVLLKQNGFDDKARDLISRYCVESENMSTEEQSLISKFSDIEEDIINAKISKLIYSFELVDTESEKLKIMQMCVNLLIERSMWKKAHTIIFEKYIPLMTKLGSDYRYAFDRCKILLEHTDGDEEMEIDCFMMDSMRKVLEGEVLSAPEMDRISNELNSRWGTFALRREMCRCFLNKGQPGAYEALEYVDAVPKAELITAKNSNL